LIDSDSDRVTAWMLQVPPPFTPKVKSEGDFSNFDKFDDEDLKILPKDKYAKEFADF